MSVIGKNLSVCCFIVQGAKASKAGSLLLAFLPLTHRDCCLHIDRDRACMYCLHKIIWHECKISWWQKAREF